MLEDELLRGDRHELVAALEAGRRRRPPAASRRARGRRAACCRGPRRAGRRSDRAAWAAAEAVVGGGGAGGGGGGGGRRGGGRYHSREAKASSPPSADRRARGAGPAASARCAGRGRLGAAHRLGRRCGTAAWLVGHHRAAAGRPCITIQADHRPTTAALANSTGRRFMASPRCRRAPAARLPAAPGLRVGALEPAGFRGAACGSSLSTSATKRRTPA